MQILTNGLPNDAEIIARPLEASAISLGSLTLPLRNRACRAGRVSHDNLKERTFRFAVATIRSVKPLIGDPLGRFLVGQVVRSGAGVASNYNSACHAKSRADFASKVSIVAEEAAETVLWFRLLIEIGLLAAPAVEPPIIEGQELTSIAVASARTARRPRREGV